MKKIITIIIVLTLLCGCKTSSPMDYKTAIDNIFNNYLFESTHRANNNTKYYSYYLPSDIQEYEFDDTYHHFIFYSSDFDMNLNVNYILCDNVFFTESENPFEYLSNYSIYNNAGSSSINNDYYKFDLYLIDNEYYFSLYTNKLTFFGVTDINEIEPLVNHILEINSSTVLDIEKIIDTYYLGTTIEYVQPELELFDKYIPIEGTIEGLLSPSTSEESDSEIETTQEEIDMSIE